MNDEQAISQLLSIYTRAADRRDSELMKNVFLPDGVVDVFLGPDKETAPLGHLEGGELIGQAVVGGMKPHPERGWSHHRTTDHIVEIEGDEGHLEAHFVVYNTVGAAEPEGGWPKDAFGAQGTITPIESGYYRPSFRRVDGKWLISRMVIVHDLPYVFPQDPTS